MIYIRKPGNNVYSKGDILYNFDGRYVRKGSNSTDIVILYTVNGNCIHRGGSSSNTTVYYIDGNNIRRGGSHGYTEFIIKDNYIYKTSNIHSRLYYIDYQPDFPQYNIPTQTPNLSKQNGCYIATYVYGSYNCPEVWTLRRYRDYHLAKKPFGQLLIRTYYIISPHLVKSFGNNNKIKKVLKHILDRIVFNLLKKGYRSTKYCDQ